MKNTRKKTTEINKAEKIISTALKHNGNNSLKWLEKQLIIVRNGGKVYIK